MPSRATRLLLALSCAASLSACSSDDEPKPEPNPDPPTVPYDGPWAALLETGEWTDQGALDTCSALGAPAACGDATAFDMSGCDTSSLAGQERQGAIFRARIRYEGTTGASSDIAYSGGGFRLDATGQPVSVMGAAASNSLVRDGTFVVSGQLSRPGNIVDRYTFAGCHATGPGTITGCLAWCRNGQLHSRGTFRAERMTWRQGEPESTGIDLVSETRVERGFPVDVYVTKGHAYVVSVNAGRDSGGLTVLDVSNPRVPVQRASLTLPNDAYWNGVWAKDHALYVASAASGVIVYDISNPASPVLVSKVTGVPSATTLDVHTVFVEGNRLYAMSPSARQTRVFDISDPLAPSLLFTYTYAGRGYPHDALATGGRLYVNHTVDGFLVVDVSGVNPTLLGRYAYANSYSHANAIGVFNGRTLAFEGGETLGAHVRVLDVTNPAGIAKVGEYRLRDVTSIHNMVLVGSRLYIAHYHEGVRVLDVSDPTRLREVAHFNSFRETDPERTDGMFEGAIGMRVPGDGYVYVVDTSRGLLIFDEP
ncbi:LVIVD repeat-containing protein [Pyxidicoccus sp. 3LG]